MTTLRAAAVALLLALAAPVAASADRLVDPGGPRFKSVQPQSITTFGNDLVAFGGFVYFAADDNVNGNELWRTDGTTTTLVANINPGASGASSNPTSFTIAGNRLFFNANPGDSTPTVFYIDSGDLGTVKTAKATPTDASPVPPARGPLVGAVNGKAIISRYTEAMGYAAYALGDSGDTFTKVSGDEQFAAVNVFLPAAVTDGWMYYAGTRFENNSNDTELWRTNGSATERVTDINPGSDKSSSPTAFVATGNRVYFMADDGVHGRELWTSNTAGDTHLVHEHNPGLTNTDIEETGAVANGDILYYAPNDPTTGREVWRTDGSDAGTRVVKDISPGTGGFDGPDPFPFKTGVVMLRGTTVYYADGSPDNATTLAETAGDGYGPNTPVVLGDRGYFVAGAPQHGQQIWRTDGTAAGTIPLTAGGLEGTASGCTCAQSLAVLGSKVVFFGRSAQTATSGEVQPYVIDTTQPDPGATPTPTPTATPTPAATKKLTVKKKAKLSGKAKVGKKLKLSLPKFGQSGVKLSFRWYANKKQIKKQKKSSLKLTKKQKGKKITAKITAKKAGFKTITLKVGPTKKVK